MSRTSYLSLVLAAVVSMAAVQVGAAALDDDEVRSQAIVRLLNSRASGAPKPYAEAAAVVSADAAAGKPLQRFVLAIISTDPGVPAAARLDAATREQYLKTSRPQIRALAAKTSNPLALYLLALDAGDTNLLRRAAEGGNVQAENAWGSMLVSDADGEPPNPRQRAAFACGFAFFRSAAAKGDANGLYNLGMCYARGLGTKRDDEAAFNCFRTAAEKGHPEAINNLGWFFREGRVVSKDLAVAARWFAKSADYGNAYGQLNYALALQRGEGVAVDDAKAAALLKASADQGNLDAVNAYGVALWRGRGVKADAVAAVRFFRAASEQGYPPAMDNLSDCYHLGAGVDKSDEESLQWKIRARAARGDGAARDWLIQHGLKLR